MLDKQVDFYFKFSNAKNSKKVYQTSIQEARKNVKTEALGMGLKKIVLEKVEDYFIDREDGTKLETRTYFADLDEENPIFIFFHGGGYALYDIDTHDTLCRYFCKQLNCNVVSINYRRSPEHVYPAAFEDALLGTKWVLKHLDRLRGHSDQVMIGGDSVGGELTRMVQNHLQQTFSFCLSVLLYPVVSYRTNFDSYMKYGEGYSLDSKTMEWFVDMYYQSNISKHNVYDCNSEIKTTNMTYVAIAGMDILKDSTLEYVTHLNNNGQKVDHRVFESLPHNFALMAGKIKGAAQAMETICKDIRNILFESFCPQKSCKLLEDAWQSSSESVSCWSKVKLSCNIKTH